MKIHPSFRGHGRPVLVSCNSRFETLPGSGQMIIIPLNQGFGAATYFNGDLRISHTIFCKEFDGCCPRYQYDDFVQAADKILQAHLESPLVQQSFKIQALELIKECPLI